MESPWSSAWFPLWFVGCHSRSTYAVIPVPAPGWGHGYATEAGDAVARWALHRGGVQEVFALVSPGNDRAVATARRIGMEWIGETDQYHQQKLELYRIRHDDLAYCEIYETEEPADRG